MQGPRVLETWDLKNFFLNFIFNKIFYRPNIFDLKKNAKASNVE